MQLGHSEEKTSELYMSKGLYKDMMTLAGGDEELLKQASEESSNLNSMKCNIIDKRFKKIERGERGEGEGGQAQAQA